MQNIIISFFVVVAGVMNTFALSQAAEGGQPTSLTLLVRGIVCLVLTLCWSSYKKESLIPSKLSPQLYRILLSGLGLYLSTSAYLYLRASSVSLISRLDLPFTILLGSYFGFSSNNLKKLFSLVAVLVAIGLALFFKTSEEITYGYVQAIASAVLISISYLLIKKTAIIEGPAILTLTPALGCIFFGGIWLTATPSQTFKFDYSTVWQFISGISMFGLYRLTRRAYQYWKLGEPEMYGVVVALIVFGLEQAIFGKEASLSYVLSFLTLSALCLATGLLERIARKR